MEAFLDYSKYYDAFYKDKDYRKEAEEIDSLIKKYGSNPVSKIILYGCGTGKHDREFAGLGYKCHGIDLSEGMINEAKKKAEENGLNISYEKSDIREYVPREKYDAVLSLFHVMSYQTENEDILKTFKSARSAMDENGLFIFDAWYGPGVLSDPPAVRIKEAGDDTCRYVRLCKPEIHPNKNVVDVNYQVLVFDERTGKREYVNEIKETHRMRYVFGPEIKYMLSQTGFELLDIIDCKSLKAANLNSWTAYFVARCV